MNIATIGPAGYRFQDLACIELALRFCNRKSIKMLIESNEDATLCYEEAGAQKTVEVQVKQSKDDVSLEFLAEILAHFSASSITDFLLKRIVENDNSSALLIAGGRCLDATRAYLRIRWDGTPHENNFLKLDAVEQLKQKLELVEDSAVTLRADRNSAVKSFLNPYKKTKFRNYLRKIAVEEQVSEDELTQSCKQQLFQLFRIPEDVAGTVILELRENITLAKNSRIDFMPLFDAAINKFFNRTKSKKYISRSDESRWNVSLFTHQALLLSGPPKCGKSFAALHYAAIFEEKNYEVEKGDDVRTAERFLTLDVPHPRAYILEDPFGGVSKSINATDSLSRLRKILASLGSDRRLIVTQRKDILLSVMGAVELPECAVGNVDWFDLDTSDTDFLKRAWTEFCAESNVNRNTRDFVSQLLDNGEQIEVGSLRHLATTSEKLSGNPTRHEILKAARPDANDMAAELGESQAGASLLSALAFTTSPSISLNARELEFILDSTDFHLPGFRDVNDLGTFYGPKSVEEEPPPTYPIVSKLNQNFQDQLDLLERRCFVEYLYGSYNFSHPFYRSVGQSSTNSRIKGKRENLIRSLRRAIYCLSANTSSTTVLSFSWILEENKKDIELTQILVELAMEAFQHTLFVRTQQNCYRFLVSHLSMLSVEFLEKMPEFSQRLASVSLSDIRWVNSEALFYWGNSQDGFTQYLKTFGSDIDETNTTPIVKRNYNKEQISDYVSGLTRRPQLLTQEDAMALLNYEESIIRAQVSKIWFRLPRENDYSVITKIFQDDQPNVLINALQSLIEFSDAISADRLSYIATHLKDSLKSPLLASAAVYRLDLFDDDDDFAPLDERPANFGNRWRIFSAMAPVMLEHVPHTVGIISPRFANCMTETLRSDVSLEEKISTTFAWLNWVERKANLSIPLDDWILRALEGVLEFIPKTLPSRLDILRKYSRIQGTQYRLIFIQEMCRYWNELTDNEFNLLYEVLKLDDNDIHWKLATVFLNAENDLLAKLDAISHSRGEQFHFRIVPDSNVETALIYLLCSLSPTASRVGVGTFSHTSWEAYLQKIAEEPKHKYFVQAFENLRTHHIEKLNEVLLQAYERDKVLVVDLLWRIEADLGGLWNRKGWEMLYGSADDDERKRIIEVLSSNVHLFIENIRELEVCFGREIANEIFAKTGDFAILQFFTKNVFNEFADSDNEELRENFRNLFVLMLSEAIVFPETYALIEGHTRKLVHSWEDFLSKLKDMRIAAYSVATEKRKLVTLNTRLSYDDEKQFGWLER